ncbi:MAG: SGNH/GDSL hydrolase family protein [Opitutaceae bacterium]|jgi:lysophospholipase L1-like esterase
MRSLPFLTLIVRSLITSALFLSASIFATPEKWAAEIDKFTQADAIKAPAKGAVVFVGSSSIRKWTSLAADFSSITTLNRGFGGSELSDSVFYADRVVIPYAPRTVVVYAGENDLQAGKSAEALLADFQAFCTKIHTALPKTKIIFLAVKESPSRAKIRDKVLLANKLIAAECAKDPRRAFVDVATPMLDAEGKTRPELFLADQLHMQPTGYAIWTKVLGAHLKP